MLFEGISDVAPVINHFLTQLLMAGVTQIFNLGCLGIAEIAEVFKD